jgi:phytanoyl-CoA hydroxylase
VVLHGKLPHGSAPNRSTVSRHACTLHLIDGACAYPADNWLQRGPDLPLRGFEIENLMVSETVFERGEQE